MSVCLCGWVQAALGTKWAHCVNTRLMLEVAADASRAVTARGPLHQFRSDAAWLAVSQL